MPQLGRFFHQIQNTDGVALSGATATIYREGATVSGTQAGVAPLTVTVRHPGKIVGGDTVFIETAIGTLYSVNSATATTLVLSGFAGILTVLNGQRIVPSNNQPTLYSDDQGGATTANPLPSSATGAVSCSMETGAVDYIVAGGGITTTLFQGDVVPAESPAVVFSGELDSATAVAHIEDTRFVLATAGAKLKSGRNLGVEKWAIDKDGTGIFPRLGQSSSGTTGGALRFVDGSVFPLTVAGVQAALDECEAAGGGTVYVPSNASILISTTPVKIPNRVALWGTGSCVPGNPTFRADNSTNANAVVQNKTQDGTGQFVGLRNVQIDGGGKASSGTITKAALWFKQALSSSYIKDIRITNVPGKGALLEGTSSTAQGPYYTENFVVANCNDDCIVVNEAGRNMVFNFVEVDNPGTGKACVRLVATTSSGGQSIGINLNNLYCEMASDATANALVVDSCANVHVDGLTIVTPSGTLPSTPVIIKGAGNFAGGSSGFTLRNAYIQQDGPNGILIDDQTCNVQVKTGPSGAQPFRFIDWYSSPVAVGTNGIQSQGQIVGMQYQKLGPGLVAASTLTLHEGNYFIVSGATAIDNIAGFGTCDAGRVIILETSGAPTIKHNSGGTGNIRLVGSADVVMSANDTIQLAYNGTVWKQVAPVVVI